MKVNHRKQFQYELEHFDVLGWMCAVKYDYTFGVAFGPTPMKAAKRAAKNLEREIRYRSQMEQKKQRATKFLDDLEESLTR